MKLKKLVALGFIGTELEDNYWEELDELAESRALAKDEAEAAKHDDADGLLVKLGAKVPKDLIDKFPNLKYIGMLGTGYGGIDTKHTTSKSITVTNIADYATEGVAEFTFGILLEHLRDISKAKQQSAKGDYSDDFSGTEIKGKKFGVIGLGNIGRRTAELAAAFGADVCYWSHTRKKDAEAAGIKYSEIDGLLESSDVITLNLALNSETDGFISAERIKQIKPNAVFINPSPMELIDFDALVSRLKQNNLTFFWDHTDEVTQEQLNVLKPLKNVIPYPPIGYLTAEASQLKKRIYVDNLKNFLAGNPTNKVG